MTFDELLAFGRAQNCSDLHISVGEPPVFRVNGELARLRKEPPFTQQQVEQIVEKIVPASLKAEFAKGFDADFCLVMEGGMRQRVNVFRQQNGLAIALRFLHDHIPTLDQLRLPEALMDMALLPRGLILVTGPTGSGKSTTLAAMVDAVNHRRRCHIMTVEDPVEYKYAPDTALIHQREVGVDVPSFAEALRSALREDPDVILVGEMRDHETIAAALTAAETGHLVLSTLHTTGAAMTAQRIIDVFPAHQQQQVRIQLANALRGVVTQQLVPTADGKGRVAAVELLISNEAVANMIRENKCHQINSVLQTGAKTGMQSLDAALGTLVRQGTITFEAAIDRCTDKENLKRYCAM